MTTTKTRQTTKTADPAPATGLNLTVRRSEGIERAKRAKETNPTEEAVKASLTEGPLAYDVANEEEAKKVQSLLRRAAQDNQLGLSMQARKHSNGTWTVDFQATNVKRARKYTAADIREWAASTAWGAIVGPIPPSCREEFKIAKGYSKVASTN